MNSGYTIHHAEYATREDWDIATGLQQVDDLSPSNYLYELSEENINKKLSLHSVEKLLYEHHEQSAAEEKEADIVSMRIAECLTDTSFSFRPSALAGIHRRLFTDILTNPGNFRTVNITKNEPILNGKTVIYASYDDIQANLDYDFTMESRNNYNKMNDDDIVKAIVKFCSNIWQTHSFIEGNTRTVAVFMEKYLRTKGFLIDNKPFARHAKYFRNALVRANFSDYTHAIPEDTIYLTKFFTNVLFDGNNHLSNKELICKELFPECNDNTTINNNFKL